MKGRGDLHVSHPHAPPGLWAARPGVAEVAWVLGPRDWREDQKRGRRCGPGCCPKIRGGLSWAWGLGLVSQAHCCVPQAAGPSHRSPAPEAWQSRPERGSIAVSLSIQLITLN